MNIPYFLWDYDLTQNQIRTVLHGDNEVEKLWLTARILTHAKFEDIWQYLTLKDIIKVFPQLRLTQKPNKTGNTLSTFGDTMYKLQNNPILHPHQITLLSLFLHLLLANHFSSQAALRFRHFTKNNLKFWRLFKLAKQKDTGLSEFHFANTISDVDKFETLPRMKIPFDKNSFVKFYQELSRNLLLKIKPKK